MTSSVAQGKLVQIDGQNLDAGIEGGGGATQTGRQRIGDKGLLVVQLFFQFVAPLLSLDNFLVDLLDTRKRLLHSRIDATGLARHLAHIFTLELA